MYEKIKRYCDELDEKIAKLNNKISKLPEGYLQCHVNGQSYKWFHFHENGKPTKYIKKRDAPKARKLALKTFAYAQLQDALFERHALDYYISHEECLRHSDSILKNKGFTELLALRQTADNVDCVLWEKAEYPSTTEHPEGLTVPSATGIMVRSKSEAFIDWALKERGIPHRYECDIEINGQILHPDFTLRHPRTGETFLWEHFGMMDNTQYARNALSKLQLYYSAGYIPFINLLITSETSTQPLDSRYVILLIEHFFK